VDVFEAINTRSSASVLRDPGPTDQQWEMLLRAGARAPDHGRLRPWRFLIVRGEARELLGDVMAEALRASKPDRPSEALDRERRKPSRAPAILVVAVVPVPHSGVPEIEQILAGGAAAQNILLAAHAMGLGSCLIGFAVAAMKNDPSIQRSISIPAEETVYAVIALGYPDETYHSVIRRKNVEPRYFE